jgi:hypothetical protein
MNCYTLHQVVSRVTPVFKRIRYTISNEVDFYKINASFVNIIILSYLIGKLKRISFIAAPTKATLK